jgi:hypothetical protein
VLSGKARTQRRRLLLSFSKRTKHLALQSLLAVRGAFSADDSFRYDVQSKGTTRLLSSYVGYFRRWEVRERRNVPGEGILLWNKILTNRILVDAGIPTSHVRLILADGVWYDPQSAYQEIPLDRAHTILRGGSYIAKPVCLRWGRGVFLVEIDVAGCYASVNGQSVPGDMLLEQIMQESAGDAYLIEDKIDPHHELKALAPTGLPTLRVMTARTTDRGILPFGAGIRIPTPGSITDNWSSGGVAAPVGLGSGLVGRPTRKIAAPADVRNNVSRHLQAKMRRLLIPNWPEPIELAVRAHRLLPGLTSIGWDIAIAEDRAVVIEGNDDWDIVFPQVVMGQGLWETDFRQVLEQGRPSYWTLHKE